MSEMKLVFATPDVIEVLSFNVYLAMVLEEFEEYCAENLGFCHVPG